MASTRPLKEHADPEYVAGGITRFAEKRAAEAAAALAVVAEAERMAAEEAQQATAAAEVAEAVRRSMERT